MKKIIAFLCIVSLSKTSFSQQKAGTITYEKKMNIWKNLPDEQMRQYVPEYRTSKHKLSFTDSTASYVLIPEAELPDAFEGGGGQRRVMRFGGGGDGEQYSNYNQLMSIQSSEFMGKNFLITDTIKKQGWKITNQTKTILGFTCRKAIVKMEPPTMGFGRRRNNPNASLSDKVTGTTSEEPKPKEIEIEAWFCMDIPTPAGPESYGQLPGAILEINRDNGAETIIATEVKATVDAKDIKEPKKGKKLTKAEYAKTMKDFFESQGGNFSMPGPNGGTIRIGTNL